MCRAAALAVVLLALMLSALGYVLREERNPQGPPLELSLATQAVPHSGLIAIAEEKGFFKEAGLNVSVTQHISGLASLEALRREEVQVATLADIAFSWRVEEPSRFLVIASIGLSAGNRIVARRDRGILEPSDLRGKRVGFTLDSTNDYFLSAFLLVNGIARSEVKAEDISTAKMVEAIVKGEVDAISAFDIQSYEAKKRLGENAVSWESQNNLYYHLILLADGRLVESPEAIRRLLRALIRAEDFFVTHRGEAQGIVMRRWGLKPEYMQQAWGITRLNVALSQALLISMETFARWKLNKGGGPGVVPDFLNTFYLDALETVHPRAVTVFR